MIDLVELDDQLNDLAAQCVRNGVAAATTARIVALRQVIPNIEKARERQK